MALKVNLYDFISLLFFCILHHASITFNFMKWRV